MSFGAGLPTPQKPPTAGLLFAEEETCGRELVRGRETRAQPSADRYLADSIARASIVALNRP